MVKLTGYQITEQIYQGIRTLVYRGQRLSDQKPVVIKILRNQHPKFSEILQFRNQYTLGKNLNLPGVIQTYSLELYQNSYALILEDFGGISLKQEMQKWGEQGLGSCEEGVHLFFKIALDITGTLDQLYHHQIIHKDIKPAGILIHPQTHQVKLIDFSIASLLPKETAEIKNPNILEGTLAYLSPEQTGRMNRAIDYRTDFYSLGVTFFELLTGRLPFLTDDLMELVHCHLAEFPPWVHHLNPRVPVILSRLVMKLMAKNAEDRYQSARGLKYDLEQCWKGFHSTQEITEFSLGERDLWDRFVIPEKLYGRQAEVTTLLQAFEVVVTGNRQMILVAGFSGIGKTAVVHEVHKPIIRQRGYFIAGKYDQFQRNIPFSAFVQAFRDLIRQLLSESDQQLQVWREKILKAVPEMAQVIIEVIPELERLLGTQPSVAQLSGSAAQNRFHLVFHQFIQVFTTPEHPLVIFLDDLQWIDAASLNLLQVLMKETDTAYLLVIGAYRDHEVSAAHPLMLTLEELKKRGVPCHTITLMPLEFKDINHLIVDTLHCSHPMAVPLTELVMQKTQGNPFFATQFLKALYYEQLITFNPQVGYWQCDLSQIKMQVLTDDVVEFMAWQLQKLPPGTQHLLQLAACMGNRFDLETLAIVCEQTVMETATQLWKALQSELILPTNQLYKFFQGTPDSKVLAEETGNGYPLEISYRFLHDRVQQAAYFLIPAREKPATHLKIGQLLLEKTPASQQEVKRFEIVNQLNLGISLLTIPSQRQQLAELNLGAGEKAKTATAYSVALNYALTGISLLPATAWDSHPNLTRSLYELALETSYFTGNFEQTQELSEIILNQSYTPCQQVIVYEIKLQVYVAQNQLREAIHFGLSVLRSWSINIPAPPTEADTAEKLQQIYNLHQGKNILNLVNLPYFTESDYLPGMRILAKITAAAYIAMPALYPLVVLAQVEICITHGNNFLAPFAYAQYGLILCGVIQDINIGYQFGQVAMALLAKPGTESVKAKTFLLVAGFINHWQTHGRETLPLLRQAYQIGLETGDLEFAAYGAFLEARYGFLVGDNLQDLLNLSETYTQGIAGIHQPAPLGWHQILHQTLLNLITGIIPLDILSGEIYNETQEIPLHKQTNDLPALHYLYSAKLMLSYFMGDYENALVAAQQASNYLPGVTALFVLPHFYLYAALTCLAIYEKIQDLTHLESVNHYQEKLKFWANHAPMNCLHKFQLVEAEWCRVLGQKAEAINFYDLAITGAQEHGYIQEAALANELAGQFYLKWGKEKIAQVYIEEAYYGYTRWGAKAKVQQLEQHYPQLLAVILQSEPLNLTSLHTVTTPTYPQSSLISASTTFNISDALDFTSLLKAAQAISSSLELEKLITTLTQIILENSGGEICAVILPHQGEWQVQALHQVHTSPVTLITPWQPQPLNQTTSVPRTLIYYVKHTQETLILENPHLNRPDLIDDYVETYQPQSILCLPIINQGNLLGILYLENRLTPKVFRRDRLTIINFLCSQAAISLENAYFYQQTQEYAQQIEQAYQDLQATQAELAQNQYSMRQQALALVQLSQTEAINPGNLLGALQELTEITAQTLAVARVSVWIFDPARTKITCLDLYEATKNQHSQGIELFVSQFPSYFAAIESEAILVASDAQTDPQTCEFTDIYLKPLNIQSMLDSGFHLQGEVGGVICCENVGSQRDWTHADQTFIRSVANLVALFIESSHRQEQATKLQTLLSKLQQTQLQLVQSEKMSALGNLVAGIAHEINNPLGFIAGNLEEAQTGIEELIQHLHLYQAQAPAPEIDSHATDIDLDYLLADIPQMIASMKVGCERIKNISNSLRVFSRSDQDSQQLFNVHDGIDSTLMILKHRFKANEERPAIRVITYYGDIPPIHCYPGQLNQVFMNLLSNAIDALEEKNCDQTFVQVAANPNLIKIYTQLSTHPNYVIIRIQDNGAGIPEDIQGKIYDHLFTTKAVGKGTGLGLAISRQIVEDVHGGQLHFTSKLGAGTEFTIELPIIS